MNNNMTMTKETISIFFDKFPFKEKITVDKIDYCFFETLFPKIQLVKEIYAVNPPNLNIFDGFNIGKNELKHCSLLSWFFDPGGNHCQGELFLSCFLNKFDLINFLQYIQGGYFTVYTEDNYSEHGRVDIFIYNKKFWIIIEAKIMANEQSDQIERYNKILDKKSMILGIPRSMCKVFFLTIDGRTPNSGKADHNISWKDIAGVLQDFTICCKNEYILSTAKQYSKFIHSNFRGKYV